MPSAVSGAAPSGEAPSLNIASPSLGASVEAPTSSAKRRSGGFLGFFGKKKKLEVRNDHDGIVVGCNKKVHTFFVMSP